MFNLVYQNMNTSTCNQFKQINEIFCLLFFPYKDLATSCIFYTQSTSQFRPATFRCLTASYCGYWIGQYSSQLFRNCFTFWFCWKCEGERAQTRPASSHRCDLSGPWFLHPRHGSFGLAKVCVAAQSSRPGGIPASTKAGWVIVTDSAWFCVFSLFLFVSVFCEWARLLDCVESTF